MSDRLLARIIHDGASRHLGVARDGGVLEQDADRLSGEPPTDWLVAAENPRLHHNRSWMTLPAANYVVFGEGE